MPTFNRQNASLSEGLLQETINKTTKNMANIDHYHVINAHLTPHPIVLSLHYFVGMEW